MRLGPQVGYGRVLALGDYRQTATVVRSLGRAGFEFLEAPLRRRLPVFRPAPR